MVVQLQLHIVQFTILNTFKYLYSSAYKIIHLSILISMHLQASEISAFRSQHCMDICMFFAYIVCLLLTLTQNPNPILESTSINCHI